MGIQGVGIQGVGIQGVGIQGFGLGCLGFRLQDLGLGLRSRILWQMVVTIWALEPVLTVWCPPRSPKYPL